MAATPLFSPGPWRVETSPARGTLCVVTDDTWICGELVCTNDTAIPGAESRANARLIAAAPTLYEALLCARALIDKVMERDIDSYTTARVTDTREAKRGAVDPEDCGDIPIYEEVLAKIDAALARATSEAPNPQDTGAEGAG